MPKSKKKSTDLPAEKQEGLTRTILLSLLQLQATPALPGALPTGLAHTPISGPFGYQHLRARVGCFAVRGGFVFV